jgi:hypothetical protein
MRKRSETWMCVDPGHAGTGVALLTYGPPVKLLSTTVIKPKRGSRGWIEKCIDITNAFSQEHLEVLDQFTLPRPVKIFMEVPRLWSASGRSLAASEDLLILSALIGMIAFETFGTEFIQVPVHMWKGQLPKKVVADRVKKAFDLDRIPNHAADAAGIGLWLSKGGLIALEVLREEEGNAD